MHQNGHNIFEECRLPVNWETADVSLQGYYRRLNQLRSTHPVLWTGDRRVLHINPVAGTYAYLCSATSNKILVAVNTSKSPQTISISNPGFQTALDYLNGNRVEIWNNALEIHLLPQTGGFICP
jgi:hypothetical protein